MTQLLAGTAAGMRRASSRRSIRRRPAAAAVAFATRSVVLP